MLDEYCHVYTNNHTGIGTPQRSANIMHCVSLERLYSLVRAGGSSMFTFTKNYPEKWGGPGAHVAPFHAAMELFHSYVQLAQQLPYLLQ